MITGAQKRALIVGISDYTYLQTLDICKNDAAEVYKLLSSLGYEISDENKLLGEAKGERLKEAIYDFFSDIKSNPDDTLLFYYSGHGVPDIDGDIYLASSDINPNEPYRRGFSFEELSKMIQRSISSKVVVILDSCYSGSAKISKGNEEDTAKVGRITIEEKSRKLQEQGKYILSASQALQEAYALTTGEHSIFTYYLLQGLKGDTKSIDSEGNVTPESLGKYAYREIMSLPLDKRPRQKPMTRAEGSANIILASYPELKPLRIEDILISMLKLLRESKVQEFNKMREENSAILPMPDFSMENLQGVHIAGANLSSANLKRANLSAADLEGANLSSANLFRADLEGANLSKTNFSKSVLESSNLSNANLTRANLSNANLTRANLSNANIFSGDLQQANLIGADLRGTNLDEANLIGTDLRGATFEERNSKGSSTVATTTTTENAKEGITTTIATPMSFPVELPIPPTDKNNKEIEVPKMGSSSIVQKKLEINKQQKPLPDVSLTKKSLDQSQIDETSPSTVRPNPIDSIYDAATKTAKTAVHKGILGSKTKTLSTVLVMIIVVVFTLAFFNYFNHSSTTITNALNNSTFELKLGNQVYPINYQITGAKITDISAVKDNTSILIKILSSSNGKLDIALPRNVIDAKSYGNQDTNFIVLEDGQHSSIVYPVKVNTQFKVLSISFNNGTNQIEISGTQMAPATVSSSHMLPNNKYVLNDKGLALNGLGDYTHAIQYFDKALAIDPKFEDALKNKDYVLNTFGYKSGNAEVSNSIK
jgi:uncharacterized protein YjbI with pentapeptide repeats